MTDTCTRCGERPAAPGKYGDRCAQCAGEIVRERNSGTWAQEEHRILRVGLDRLATYYETTDPHLRAECKRVARANLRHVGEREG